MQSRPNQGLISAWLLWVFLWIAWGVFNAWATSGTIHEGNIHVNCHQGLIVPPPCNDAAVRYQHYANVAFWVMIAAGVALLAVSIATRVRSRRRPRP